MTPVVQPHRVETVSLVACIGLIVLIFELVRRHRIKEKYSLLWFVTGFSLLALALNRQWLEKLSTALGIFYPPTALLLVLSFFTIVILIHFSIVISSLIDRNQKLAQKIALLEAQTTGDTTDKKR
jgi:hypothetical protein